MKINFLKREEKQEKNKNLEQSTKYKPTFLQQD